MFDPTTERAHAVPAAHPTPTGKHIPGIRQVAQPLRLSSRRMRAWPELQRARGVNFALSSSRRKGIYASRLEVTRLSSIPS